MSKTMVMLDFSMRKEVHEFLLRFQEPIYVKIGMEPMHSFGSKIIWEVKAMGYQILLDLKLHDIPNTIEQAMKSLTELGVDVVNLHVAGGSTMMRAVIEDLEEGVVDGKRPLCIAVTQLTNASNEAMNKELLIPGDVKDVAISYAKLAKESGLDGVVCSIHEAKVVHKVCGSDFLMVIPGIRLASDSKDGQERMAAPAFAREQGYDYIVVGRNIAKSAGPVATYHGIERTMEGR